MLGEGAGPAGRRGSKPGLGACRALLLALRSQGVWPTHPPAHLGRQAVPLRGQRRQLRLQALAQLSGRGLGGCQLLARIVQVLQARREEPRREGG